jgi:NAD(P)H-flavin reductase
MGKETWTGKLGALAKSHSKKPYMTINSLNLLNSDRFVVNLDGPYGKPMISPYDYDVVILVAGGIGVTPMHSMLMHLFNRYYNDGRIKNVIFLC